MVFIDLDDLKGVNDTLGHDAGDAVIRSAAQRLRGVIRRGDIVCGLAGDEFVILIVGTCDRAALDDMTHRINARLAEPMTVAGFTVRIGASIGVVATSPGDPRDATALMRTADQAMYAAKARGRRTVVRSTGMAEVLMPTMPR